MSDELRDFVPRYLWGIIEGIFFASICAWFISVLNSIGCMNPAFEEFEWTPEKQEATEKIFELLGLASSITFWTSFVSLLSRWLYRRITRGVNKFIGKIK